MVKRIDSIVSAEEEARRAGIDIDLLDTILALSPTERCRHHDEALAFILELENAKALRDAKLQSVASASR